MTIKVLGSDEIIGTLYQPPNETRVIDISSICNLDLLGECRALVKYSPLSSSGKKYVELFNISRSSRVSSLFPWDLVVVIPHQLIADDVEKFAKMWGFELEEFCDQLMANCPWVKA